MTEYCWLVDNLIQQKGALHPIVVESSGPIAKGHQIVTNKLWTCWSTVWSRLVQWVVHWLHNYNSPSPNIISVNLQPTLHFDDRGGSRHIVQIERGNTVLRRQLDRRRCQRIDVWPHCVSDPLSFPTRGGNDFKCNITLHSAVCNWFHNWATFCPHYYIVQCSQLPTPPWKLIANARCRNRSQYHCTNIDNNNSGALPLHLSKLLSQRQVCAK